MKTMHTNMKRILSAVALLVAVMTALFCLKYTSREYTVTVTDAMDTVSSVSIRNGITSKKLADECVDIIHRYDKMLSMNNPQSEIYGFNHSSTGFAFSEEIYEMLHECGRLYADTNARFDITVGAVSGLWASSFITKKLPDSQRLLTASALTDYSTLSFDDESLTVTKSIPNQELSVGAVAKGYIADKIANYLKMNEPDGALIDLGGNIYVCGSNGKGKAWSIGIQDPDNSSELIGQILLNEGFVITSGDYQRYMISDGIRYHHILDAKTGNPSNSGLRSVTIVSDNGFAGDSLSTACFITGLEDGIKLTRKYNVNAVFVTDKNEVFYSKALENIFLGKSENYSYTAF